MLNEDKIKLMNEIAMFEKRGGKNIFPVNRYFCGDYISSRMLRSLFAYTVSYLLCVMIWVLYNLEQFLNMLGLDLMIAYGRKAAFWYIAGLVLYQIITFLICRRRYEYARRGMKVYVAKLKRLEKRYEFQNRAKELTKEGGRHDDVTRA
ncbi:MAG: hypothetical protein ACI39W_06385 [Brotaphodocola sp.]